MCNICKGTTKIQLLTSFIDCDCVNIPPATENKISDNDLGCMFASYLECAIWTSEDESEDWSDVTKDSLSQDSKNKMIEDCQKFANANYKEIDGDFRQAGHDFWLTRNGHGTGFWDRSAEQWPSNGENLTKSAEQFGETYMYLCGDKLHVE